MTKVCSNLYVQMSNLSTKGMSKVSENLLCTLYTPVAKKIQPFASVWYEIRVLWPNKNLLNVIPQPWTSGSIQIWIRSFKWGTVHSCKSRGCKNVWGQSWRSQSPTWPTRTRCAWGWLNWQIFYQPPTLTFDIFAAYWPTRMQSTSFERSDSYLFGARSPGLWYDF